MNVKNWYNIENAKAYTEVQILDEIGAFGVSYNSLINDVKDVNNDIKMILNTPGGSTFEGLAIYDSFTEHKNKGYTVSVKVVGTAASMGSVLVAAATSPKHVEVAEHSRVMIHRAIGGAIGNSDEILSASKLVKSEEDKIVTILSNFTGKTEEEVIGAMAATTWYHGQEIVENGFAGKVIKMNRIKNTWDNSLMAKKYDYKPENIIMNTEFNEINSILKVDGLVIDEEKGTYLQKEQLTALNEALVIDNSEAIATALNEAEEKHNKVVADFEATAKESEKRQRNLKP
jgi:ATP-dependent Clp endopeptidase proteolytic subunit ClpP